MFIKNLNKWKIIIFPLLLIFASVITSSFHLSAEPIGEELTDNWEFDVAFYDSSVDNGTTPLTHINWDATDGSYKDGTPRIITVQINYRNTNAVTTYAPGELEISIPNFVYKQCPNSYVYMAHAEKAWWKANVSVGANDKTHSGYDWNYTTRDSIGVDDSYHKFTNAIPFEEKANFEGSIQIVYELTPSGDSVEYYDESCTHNYSTSFAASLNYKNKVLTSNTISLDYTRTYTHPWQHQSYSFYKTAKKITTLDNLGQNASDYIWVKYQFQFGGYFRDSYPDIASRDFYIKDTFPEECVVYDGSNPEAILPNSENTYKFYIEPYNSPYYKSEFYYIYVGYPKSIYNEETGNLNITNTAELYAKYNDSTEYVKVKDATVSLNLAEFKFEYSGDLYGMKKAFTNTNYSTNKLYYENLTREDMLLGSKGLIPFHLYTTALYTKGLMDVKIGDDLLYVTTQDGSYRKLENNEYYFTEMTFPKYLYNGHGNLISANKYDIELWISKEGAPYTLHNTFKNTNSIKTFTFTSNDKVTGFYFLIKDLTESLILNIDDFDQPINYLITSKVQFLKVANVSENGKVFNLSYLQVYIDDVLQNTPTIDSYANLLTQEEIASFDIATYGTYMQRSVAELDYTKYELPELQQGFYLLKTMSYKSQDAENEVFNGSSTVKVNHGFTYNKTITKYEAQTRVPLVSDDKKIKGYEFYDLLPLGMELVSTPEEIIENLSTNYLNYGSYLWAITKDGTFLDSNSFRNLLRENYYIEITENWNNTGRTLLYIKFDFSDNPLNIILEETNNSYVATNISFITFSYKWQVSYDAYFEYGSVWENEVWGDHYINKFDLDDEETDYLDLNENGLNEKLAYAKASTTISSIISTHQDVTKYVQTDKSNFSTGIVDTSPDSEYTYKLRVRTGSNDIKNLVIYDNLEIAQPNKSRWQGLFMGVDTTYATNKGYIVKVWYSENPNAGTLSEDSSWKEYYEGLDRTKVKSLAFEYLSSDGSPALLPKNSLTYVLIKMKSPTNEDLKTLARNDCFTEWTAIDELGNVVDGIAGINSNIVKVALPNSNKTDDLPTVTLKITKDISANDTDYEKIGACKFDIQTFKITLKNLTPNEDGTHNYIKGILKTNTPLVISKLSAGSYLITESDDYYFDFLEITTSDNNDHISLEKTEEGYLLIIKDTLTENMEFNIKVTNTLEPNRTYEDKKEQENIFSFFIPAPPEPY